MTIKLTTDIRRYSSPRAVHVHLVLNGACIAWGGGPTERIAREKRIEVAKALAEALGGWIVDEERDLAK